MNTGIQRSSATPPGAWTTTTPDGAIKSESKKDIQQIMVAHQIPYLATASIAYPDDLVHKFKKARKIEGTRFIHLLSPCPPGWRTDPSQTIRVTRKATQTNIFPIYEVENGNYSINIVPEETLPIEEYLKAQGRFAQMNEEMVGAFQSAVDMRWKDILAKTEKDGVS
jgi:pyruvate/2-oxoacid:ferredoxin oxidoreductase beta subunit